MNKDLVHTLYGTINISSKKIDGGVEMEDVIDYKIPFGIIGQIAHPIIVKNKLKQIFKYRENKLKELFGEI